MAGTRVMIGGEPVAVTAALSVPAQLIVSDGRVLIRRITAGIVEDIEPDAAALAASGRIIARGPATGGSLAQQKTKAGA